MAFLDEEVLKARKSVKRSEYNTLENGIYIKDELVHFAETILLENKVRIMLPDTFIDLPASIAQIKYPSSERPQVIKTSLDTKVNITFSLIEQSFKSAYIRDTLEQFRQIIKKVNPAFVFWDLTVKEKGNIGWFDYKSYGMDEQIYNIIYAAPIENKLLYGVFNCPYRDMMEWKDVAHRMLLSITDCTKSEGR